MANKPSNSDSVRKIPLCVDLDGTLVCTDVLLESILILLKQNVLYIFLFPLWLLKGKAHFKQKIADRADLDVSLFPYHKPLLSYLNDQKTQGRRLVLATASNVKYADQIARHLGLFDEVMASSAVTNLSGRHKRERLLNAFGERGFGYAGDAVVDLKIWSHSQEVILVNPKAGVQKKVEKLFGTARIFDDRQGGIKPYLKAVRLHQWSKNILVFIPLVMAHQVTDVRLLLQAAAAFLVFGLCASSVYILNDLLDLAADRQHRTKRNRPLAAGTLPIQQGILMVPLFLIAAFIIASILPAAFLAVLAVYYVTTLAYSLRLKHAALVDVLTLAGLYTVRILAGAAAVAVVPSFWLLAFSMFLFFSLALVKRYSELLTLEKEKGRSVFTRGYRSVDLELLAQSGVASGFLSVLVMALYINSDPVNKLYTHPEVIWLICPLLLYWIGRVWLLARRDEMHDDPVVFAIKDRRSHWMGVLVLLLLWLAV